ncbi:MAG: class I SAM-dependent methyltransferase [Streptosporangiales bacterium]|nr:class I SAM-dependent methyltransferase [Streptosporangiales bacterium]
MANERITFTGAQETMLATLYGRALDSKAPRSILHDTAAAAAIERIDYAFGNTRMTPTTSAGVALRARVLDDWTTEFLAAHPRVTVLHLACGLDTRVHRLAPPATVRWFDVDFPEVIELRQRLLAEPGGDYRMLGASVVDDWWLAEIPPDRPTVVVFEGLSMYLRKDDGRRLLQRLTSRFPSGQLLFDCYGSVGIKLQRRVPAVRNAGATLYWGIDDPHELETWHAGLRCLDALRSVDMPGNDELPARGRRAMRVLAHIPGLRDVGRILRYEF